jgi:hypothetical protein
LKSNRPGLAQHLEVVADRGLGQPERLGQEEKPVGTLLRSQFEGLEVVWPTDFTDLRPARPERTGPTTWVA